MPLFSAFISKCEKKKTHFLIYMKMTWAHKKDAYWSTNLTFLYFSCHLWVFFLLKFSLAFSISFQKFSYNLFSLHFTDITMLINIELTSFLIGSETCKSLSLLLPGCSHLNRLTNKQVSNCLCCQNTIEQVSDNIQRIIRINVSLSIERP